MTVLPVRPQMPSKDDQLRAELLEARLQVLTEDFDALASEWALEHMDEDLVGAMGPPDTSANPLADLCRQYSTPGLYGYRPNPAHGNPRNLALIGPGGHLDRAGYWTKMQGVQYLTLGLGDFYERLDVPPDLNDLTVRLVAPHNIYVRVHPDRPDQIVELWELRLRYWADRKAWIYAWDIYDLGERTKTLSDDGTEQVVWVRQPTYCVKAGANTPSIGPDPDVSNIFLGIAGGYSGAPGSGPGAYPYHDTTPAKNPILPWGHHKSRDTGGAHNHLEKRGATRGTLNAVLNWTYANHAALSASGKAVVLFNQRIVGGGIHAPDGPMNTRLATIQVMPGSFVSTVALDPTQGTNLWEVGAGAELGYLYDYCSNYEMHQQVRWGLSSSDATKKTANPTSGVALFISNQGKREFSRQVEEVFRRSDLDAIRVAACLLTSAGLGEFDEAGYSIVYHEIPKSAEELQAEREQIDWEESKGFLSPEQAYQRRHPGATEEDAQRAIVAVGIAKLRIAKELADQAQAAGLITPPSDKKELSGVVLQTALQTLEKVNAGTLTPNQGREFLKTAVQLDDITAEKWIPVETPDRTAQPAPAPPPRAADEVLVSPPAPPPAPEITP